MADIEGPAEPGVVNPALIAQLGAANSAYLTAKQNTVTAYEAMQRAMQAYRTAAVNVLPGTPATPAGEREVPDPLFPNSDPIKEKVPGSPATAGSGQGTAEAEKIAYEAAQAAYEQAQATEVTWLQEVARITDAVVVEEGRSPEERAAIAQAFTDQITAGGYALEDARIANEISAIELEQAQLEQAILTARTPEERLALENQKIDLDRRAGEANIAQSNASAASSAASAAATAASTLTENALRPYAVRSAAAGATVDESEAAIAAARAEFAPQLAQLDVDLQEKNLTWQEYNNQSLLLKNEFEAQLLAAGMPQIEIDQALADLESTDIANKQMDEGELVTRLTQLSEKIAQGKITPELANEEVERLRTGATLFERQQQVDANTQTAIQQAAAGGYLVGPNQKTTDPFGLLGSTFDSLGLSGQSQQPIHPQAVPEFLQSTGQMSTAQRQSDTFAPDGSYYGANGMPAFLDASQGMDIGPGDFEKMQGAQAVEKASAIAATKAEAPAGAAPSESTPGASAQPITVNISTGGGPPAAAPPPASVGQKQAEAAAAGVPGFAPASPGPPLPAPPPAGVPPVVGPKPNPGPAFVPPGPEPWGKPTGSQGMHTLTPGAAAPRQRPPAWLRSAQFAGGR